MKIILSFLILFIQIINLNSKEPHLEEVINGLKSPWSLSFINEKKVIISENQEV